MTEQEPQEIVVRGATQVPSSVVSRARGMFDPGQVELIRQTVASELTIPELGMFLEVCAAYNLDPFTKQVYAVKIDGKVQPIVSRDGFIAIANRHADFGGVEGQPVRQHDHFRSYRDPQAGIVVEHEIREGSEAPDRGELIGAWALVHREGRKPTYFFARWDSYRGTNKVWQKYPDAMILKCAEAMALRKAFSVAGVLAEEEVASMGVSGPQDLTAAPPGPDYGDDELGENLKIAMDALDYPERKRVLMLTSAVGTPLDDAQRAQLLQTLQNEIDAGAVVDAEVVPSDG